MNDELREQRRKRILDAARVELYTGSRAGASMRQIAARAGIGKGTIYEYYPCKELLLYDVMREELGRVPTVTQKLLGQQKPLSQSCRDVLQYYQEVDQRIAVLIDAAGDMGPRRELLADELEEILLGLRELFGERLEEYRADETGEAAKTAFVCMMLSQPASWLARMGRPAAVFQVSDELIGLFEK